MRPEHLSLDALVARASEPAVKEVILALNATVDGQTTAHFITDLLVHLPVKVTKLAHGVPVGGELDYLDDGTLAALHNRRLHAERWGEAIAALMRRHPHPAG